MALKAPKQPPKPARWPWIITGILALVSIVCLGLFVHSSVKIHQRQTRIDNLQAQVKQQKEQIHDLTYTKDVRNYNGVKDATDKALKGATDALYNWDGQNFTGRYSKALKYITKDALVKIASNGSLPTKKEQEETGKAYAKVNAKSSVKELQNGIQNIQGNNVTGFVWITQNFSEFGKNTVQTQQVQYTYNLIKHKFTKFDFTAFSGTVSD